MPARDWSNWMRDLGREVRRQREFLGLSQERLATAAGVSQGAISRLEAGGGLATPLLVVVKIRLVLIEGLRALDPALLSDELRRTVDTEQVVAVSVSGADPKVVAKDRGLDEVIQLYRRLPERQREPLLTILRAASEALAKKAAKEGNR